MTVKAVGELEFISWSILRNLQSSRDWSQRSEYMTWGTSTFHGVSEREMTVQVISVLTIYRGNDQVRGREDLQSLEEVNNGRSLIRALPLSGCVARVISDLAIVQNS
jgi:hypothetical protein